MKLLNADSAVNRTTNKKNKLKGIGSIEILHNKNLSVELAVQIISEDKTVRSNTVHDSKEFNSQSLSTQAKKGEKVVSMMPGNKKNF